MTDVIVIGAGLAGLQCARVLTAAGRSVRVLEASDDRLAAMNALDMLGVMLDMADRPNEAIERLSSAPARKSI